MFNWDNSSPTVTNCTFSGNSANYGGGMSNYYSSATITNCILWDDTPNEIYDDPPLSTFVTYSDVQGGSGWANEGNIDADPCFVDATAGNLRLKPDSPCIDAGDSTGLWQAGIWKDLDGKIRYFDISGVTDTGTGSVTFVDMGAYEFQCSGIAGDNNCDGVVDFKDLAILCNNWLEGVE